MTRRWLLAPILALLCAPHALAAPGDPVQVELSHCEPAPGLGSSGPGYAAPGFGNAAADRVLKVRLAYHTASTTDSVAGARDATNRIELCYQPATGSAVCPGTPPWLIFDRPSTVGTLADAAIIADGDLDTGGVCAPIAVEADCNADAHCYWTGTGCIALTPLEEASIEPGNAVDGVRVIHLPPPGVGPVDWGTSTQSPWIFVKVNGQPSSALEAAQRWGACAPPRHLANVPATNPRFDVIGVAPQGNFLGSSFDVCTEGSRVRWWRRPNGTFGSTPAGYDVCIASQQGGAVGEILVGLDEAQRTRIQAQLLAQGVQKYAWRNGARTGGFHPTHVFLGPHPGTGGQSAPGAFYMNVPAIQGIDVGASTTSFNADVVSLSSHEYMHQLQKAWGREAPASYPHVDATDMLGEALAVAVDLRLCAQNVALPGLSASCTSGWKRGQLSRGIYGAAGFFVDHPELNLLYPETVDAQGKLKLQKYPIGLVLLYAQEQFSHPLQTPAHPKGIASLVPRGSESVPLRDRASDEGVDFLGLFLSEAANAPAGWSTEAILDSALVKALGRTLDEVLFDLHTALFLKDYTDTDPRWRFLWTHKDAMTQPVPLGTGKPFSVPKTLYGQTCGCHGSPCTNVCDGLTRARRVLDSWTRPCSDDANPACDAMPDLLAYPATRSGTGLEVGPRGAALLSVFPDAGWYDRTLKVRVVAKGGTLPAFRVFRVDQLSGATNLTPVPICGSSPLWECPATTSGSEYGFTLHVPVSVKTREVLLLASGRNAKGRFDWSFGPAATVIKLSDQPTPSLQANAGTAGGGAKIPVKVRAWDSNVPLHAGKPLVTLHVPGCPFPVCTLADDDWSLLGLVGGQLQLLATLPPDFYPPGPGPGTLDLELSVAGGAPIIVPGALRYGDESPVHATALALDVGTGMETGFKLEALQRVARALIHSLHPPNPADPADHRVALISFADDADTLVPPTPVDAAGLRTLLGAVDSISPGGATSIGDGVLEAQSVLASAYDALAPLARPAGQGVVLVSDVANSAAEPPSTYYLSPTAPAEDGNGPPWYAGPLTRPAREAAGLPVPRISTVGLGPDTDDGGLAALARTGAGTHQQVRGADTAATLAELTTFLADAMGAALASAADYQRVRALRSRGPADGTIVIPVEPGVRELRVWLVSSLTSGAQASLHTPSGALRAASATSAAGDALAFRVRDPQAGDWTLTLATSNAEPHVFVEASVRGGAALLAAADTEFAAPPQPSVAGYDPGTWVGSDVRLRAALRDAGPLLDCDVSAVVLDPAGSLHALALGDDAGPGDETAGDGVYAALFTRTGLAGTHLASLRASCPPQPASGDAPVVREARTDFALHAPPDADADQLPDAWETRQGLDPRDPGDATRDDDADGLDARDELALGTFPGRDDSDGGGESDGSEAEHGRDPRDPRDDAADPPSLSPTAGNGVVYLAYGLRADGVGVTVERAPAPEGPYGRVALVPGPDPSGALDTGLPNGASACYRSRTETPASVSAWSTPRCVTPALDPVAPLLELAGAPTRSSGGAVSIPLRLEEPRNHGGPQPPVDLGTLEVAGAQLRWWTASGPDPDGGDWGAFTERLQLTLPDATDVVHLQARDGAGNESGVLSVSLGRLPAACGDLDDDNLLTPADSALLRLHLAAGPAIRLPPGALERCAVIGRPDDCDLRSAVVLRRQVEAIGLDPAIEPVCSAAAGP